MADTFQKTLDEAFYERQRERARKTRWKTNGHAKDASSKELEQFLLTEDQPLDPDVAAALAQWQREHGRVDDEGERE